MRVLVVGASGAIGTRLVPLLTVQGHHVTGTARSPEKASTSIAGRRGDDPRPARSACRHERRSRDSARGDRPSGDGALRDERRQALRSELRRDESAAHRRHGCAAGGGRGSRVSRTSSRRATPVGPMREKAVPSRRRRIRSTRSPLRRCARRSRRSDISRRRWSSRQVVFRYGGLYGSPDDAQVPELVRKRRFPLVGDGEGISSFVHLDDAASATVLALERGEPGIHNVVDDEPSPSREWLPVLAETLGAKPPRHRASPLAGAYRRGRGRCRAHDGDAWSVECKGEARARLDAPVPELARRVPRRVRAGRGASRLSGGLGSDPCPT